jgi:alcohol dehydrogenase
VFTHGQYLQAALGRYTKVVSKVLNIMTLLDLNCPTLILHEPGALNQIGIYASSWSCCRALIVSDAGIVATGHPQRAIDYLQHAGMQTQLFTDIHENPSTDDVQRGVEIANEFQPDLLIGLGGGSSMDCAKGINFLYCGGGQMQDYWGIGKATEPMLPMIAVPTTAGTGSETQSFALISDAKNHTKMACGDKKATCKLAILDPELTLTQPTRVTALTGIDALAHALETYVTTKRTELSMDYSRRAWELLSVNFIKVIDDPHDLEARSAMQLGACLSGLAIENSMLGAAHALANPLTAHFNIVHGQAVASMLPHVIRFNAQSMESQYGQLASATNAVSGDDSEALATFITEITQHSGLATRLKPQGVNADQLPMLAADAAQQWTAQFNPRTVEAGDLLLLYQQAF